MRKKKAIIQSRSGNMTPLLPQRGRVRTQVYSEILGHITDLIAGESVLLHGSEDQIEAIEKDLTKWHDELKFAEEMEGTDNEDLLNSVDKMRELALHAEEILIAFITKRKDQKAERTCFFKFIFFFDDLIAQHRFKTEISQIRSKIPQVIFKGLQRTNTVTVLPITHSQPISRLQFLPHPSESVGLDQFDDKFIVSRLTDVSGGGGAGKGRCVISIVGIGGVGKTSFARRIYEDSIITQSFPIRAWVTLSHKFSSEAVLLGIIKQVNVGFRETKRPRTAREEFMEETLSGLLTTGRYLIVLDGVTTTDVWDTLQTAFPDISNGSRIVITTRNKDVALHASSSNLLELKPLSDEAGWAFFKTKVQVPDELETVGKAIVRRCMGFPQMISNIGAELSRREATEEQWIGMLEQLKQHQASRYEALNEAANMLPSNLKQCLFYFGLFKEDYDIPARRLIVLWVAEGLVRQERNSIESPESIAEKHLKRLVEQDMIQVIKLRPDGRVKTCRMHIVLRDLWVSKAEKANFFQSHSNTTDSSSTSSAIIIRRVADHLDKDYVCFSQIHGNDRGNGSGFRSRYKNLCTFLSFDTREGDMPGDDIGNFLHEGISSRCFQGLRVLDLERVFRPKLPESIGKLIHLRYLGLRWTYLERLPTSINNLLNLQTLDLKNTYISVIPSSLWQMRQLRHLYLSENYRSRFVSPKGVSSLTYLQTLWGAFVDDEISVDALNGLTNLRKLGLVFQLGQSQQVLLARRILKLKGLESLRLVSIDKSVKPSSIYFDSLSELESLSSLYLLGKLENFSIMNLPGKLTDLTLSLSELERDPMEALGELQNLKILKLFCNAYRKKVMRCPRGSFPVLQVLKLWKQENLEDWLVDDGSLKVLRELEIRRCENLKEIPHGIKHLLMLSNLTLTDMPKTFTARVKKTQGEDWEKISHVPSLNIIPDVTQEKDNSAQKTAF
ncbi:hypothetical protein ACOSQ4_016081 [Xanthoceras sorbifolium]